MSGETIHDFFGLTYASYLVLPRSVLQSMPVDWQKKFVGLVNEARDKAVTAGVDLDTCDYRVERVITDDWGETKIDDPLADYQRGRRRLWINAPSSPTPSASLDEVGDEDEEIE